MFKAIFHVSDIEKIVRVAGKLSHPVLFRTLYLFAYFGFFRLSSLVPSSLKNFQISKHLCRGDVIIMEEYLVVLVKWSKTLQATNQGSYIMIAKVHNVNICPYRHFLQLQQVAETFDNAPCFFAFN